jgi:L,D-transpeptidase YcbB
MFPLGRRVSREFSRPRPTTPPRAPSRQLAELPLGCQTPPSAAGRQMYVVIVSFLWITLFTRSVAAQTSSTPASSLSVSGPTFDEGSVQRLKEALATYSEIESKGGWPALPQKATLKPGAKGAMVSQLRHRLVLSGDLAADNEKGDLFDADVSDAVRRFQRRHGLVVNGSVGPQTLRALNVPASKRVLQLRGSLHRLSDTDFTFARRYVVVNLPAASVEAVANGKVEGRYVAVVGNTKHASPTLTSGINQMILNPTWTVPPLSIVKNEIVPRMRRDPGYLARMHMRVLAGRNEVSPKSIAWSSVRSPNFTIRQDSGTWNALGAVKIDMPNSQAVYMHDTNNKNAFDAQYRFLSHGCTRVQNVRELAAWLLADVPGWTGSELDAAIAKEDRLEIKLPRRVPVAWIYLTAWKTNDGEVQFRDDIYDLDVSDVASVRGKLRPATKPGSYLDAR